MIMSDDIAISIKDVDKVYKLYSSLSERLSDTLGMHKDRDGIDSFAALKGINLEIKRGERVGLIGRNGAGKTTLLKLLIGHIKATHGDIIISGSVQAMIHTNLGIHLSFTGRENIISALTYNNLSPDEIVKAMADIEDFTELGDYLDQPMQNYSLGMQSRLQFAIASAIRPDILIVDEMLGSGDTYFMRKSNRRMQKLIDSGCTLLLVSHNTQQVLQFCDRGIWLRSGQVFYDAPVRDVVNAYDVYIERETAKRHSGDVISEQTDKRSVQNDDPKEEFLTTLDDGKRVFRWPARDSLKVSEIGFFVEDEPSSDLMAGEDVDLKIKLKVEKEQEYTCRYLITVWSQKGERVARIENDLDSFSLKAGDVKEITIKLAPFLIGAGKYTLNCSIYDMKNFDSSSYGQDVRLDFIANAFDFDVSSPSNVPSRTYLDAQWSTL